MKKVVFTSLAIAALMFSGCSKKSPEVTMNSGMDNDSSSNMMSDADKLKMLISDVQSKVLNVYFDFDKFNIKADQQSVVLSNAALFNKEMARSLSVKVEGNCDEWGTDEYNYALGLKRAKSVKDSLMRSGVSESRIAVVSYGESNPVCTDKTKTCDAQNRRVEFKVLP